MAAQTSGGRDARVRRALIAALVALSIGNAAGLVSHAAPADGPRPGPSPVSMQAGAPAPEAPRPTTGLTAPTPGKKAAAAPAKAAPSASTSTTLFPIQDMPIMAEGLAYELTLSPTCARPGETFTASLRLKPNRSTGSIMPFYADGSYEEGKGDLAREDGMVTYTWVARPIPGEGRLVTQARDADTEQNGTKIIPFRVVAAGASC